MKAVVNTKSNFKNLNGKELPVAEITGTRVSCYVDGMIVDFSLSEVVKFIGFINFLKPQQ